MDCRQWQAMALSLCAAVTSLAAKGPYQTGGITFFGAETFSLLLNCVCAHWPGVSSLVLATPAGRAAAVLAFESFEVRAELRAEGGSRGIHDALLHSSGLGQLF